MGKGASTKETTNQTQNSTVQLPAWMTQAGQATFNDAQATAKANPIVGYGGQMTAGTNANQQAAGSIAAAGAGTTGRSDLDAARGMTAAAVGSGVPQATATNAGAAMMSPSTQGVTGMHAATQGVSHVGPAPMATSATQTATMAGGAPTMTAAQQAPAAGWQAFMQNYAPTVGADQVHSANFDGAAAARYMNPYQDEVTSRTADEMARRNQMENLAIGDQAGAAKAFGGTRHAVLEAETRRGQEANMSDYLAKANADAYANAQGQFNQDRASGMQADLANQGSNLQADTTSAGFLDQLLGRNQAASNASAADLAAATNATNANNAGLAQDAAARNQGLEGTFRLSDQGAANQAAGANADRAQQTGLSNQDFMSRFMLSNQAAENTAMGANADRRQAAGQFNAGAANSAEGANADRAQAASGFNAGAVNTADLANADRNTQTSQFNAGLGDNFLNRLLSAGSQFGNIGSEAQGMDTRDIGNLLSTGGVQQDADNAGLAAAYNEFLRMQDAPMDRYRDLTAILSGTPRDVTTSGTSSGTTKTTQNNGWLNTIMGLGQMGASIASDRRLKRDVDQVGELPNGLGVYRYRYVWDAPTDPRRLGVMADEVERLVPSALGPPFMGYKTVNYSKLGEAF